MDIINTIAGISAGTLEIIGIGVITVYALYALFSSVTSLFRRIHPHQQFKIFRHRMVRGILLGLEFMVAADIIYTVAIERTFESVGVLVLIVLVRTFLNFTLEVEMTGRWPWQNPFDEE